jgi:hypothetical protein
MPLIDYRTLGEMLEAYAPYCRDGELLIHDGSFGKSPKDWLASLSSKEKSASITEIASDATGTRITVTIPGWFSKESRTYRFLWSSDRNGWAFPNTLGRTVHYFISKSKMEDPPYCGDDMLVALCKRNFRHNSEPFFPVDPKWQICKTCSKRLQEIIE